MSDDSLPSGRPRAQAKSRRARGDHRGDDRGIIERAPEDGNAMRDDLVSIRWIAAAMRRAAGEVYRGDQPEPSDGQEFAAQIEDMARQLEHGAAMARAFPLLWRARRGRVTAGEVTDAADLYVSGHGSVEDIVAGLLGGKFADIERDADGFIAGVWD
jgi:hypothetical protein